MYRSQLILISLNIELEKFTKEINGNLNAINTLKEQFTRKDEIIKGLEDNINLKILNNESQDLQKELVRLKQAYQISLENDSTLFLPINILLTINRVK